MLFGTICNFRGNFKNKISNACILTLFKTIGNCRQKMRIMTVHSAFLIHLKRFETEGEKMKTRMINGDNDGFWNNGAADFLGKSDTAG